jgi:hypothetical protein
MTKSPTRSPRHLSDTALVLLGKAADSEDQMVTPIPRTVQAHGKALQSVLQSVLSQGFVEEVPVVWRCGDGGRFGLRITAAGLRAIGVPALMSGLEQSTTTPQQKPPRPGTKLARLRSWTRVRASCSSFSSLNCKLTPKRAVGARTPQGSQSA